MQTLVFNIYHNQFRSITSLWSLSNALAPFEKRYLELKTIHESQVNELERNKGIHEKVTAVMTTVGMPKTYRIRDEKSRKRIKPFITMTAGYIIDLTREFPVNDGWETVEKNYATLKEEANKRIQEITEENDKKRLDAERHHESMLEDKRRNLEIAHLQIKYGLNLEDDVEEFLLRNNPLLNLAVSMEDTRNDWSEGFYRVKYALTEEVRDSHPEIYEAVYDACYEDYESDGRVFRDMKWNYNEIYSLLDNELVEDYNKVRTSY